ncbi:Putative G-protein coupled receptor (GPCR) [Gryllus bimaculatus]|nr:Putative G-protein coupled receptor (GPCR) [Gryllus bimaculatus]
MNLVLCCLLCASATVLSATNQKSTAVASNAKTRAYHMRGPGTAFLRDSGHDIRRAYPTNDKIPGNGHQGFTSPYMSDHEAMGDANCPPLDSLDFLHYNKSNAQEVEKLEKEYPCELRLYWKSANIQNLVSVVRFLFKYVTIVLIITGLLVNIYSLFVLNSPPINKCNMSVYLKALALSDIGALIFNVSVGVLRARCAWISNFYLNNGWMCTLHKILLSVFFYYSSWLVVTFTIERVLMIRNPFKIHSWQNEKPAKLAVIILAIVTLGLALIRSFTTPGFENDNMYGYEPCGDNDHKISLNMVPFMFITTIVPSVLITSTNICLLIHVRQSAQVHNNLMGKPRN